MFCLASLRIGWGYGSKQVIRALNVIKPPFNVNGLAQVAAAESLKDKQFIQKSIKHNLNYAGVFNIKKNTPCPKFVTINGRKFPTIDGDLTDWRIGDPSHTTHVIVLRVKRTPNQTEDMRKAFCVDELEKIRVPTELKREYEAKISQGIFARPALIPA